MRILVTLLPVLFITIISCSSKPEKVEELQSQVIEVHDEVMPKMDNIMNLMRQIKQVKSDTSQILPSDQLLLANKLIDDLDKASEGMMNWMRNYDSMMTGMDEAQKLNYLKQQQTAILQVKQDMLSAISSAKQFLKNREDI